MTTQECKMYLIGLGLPKITKGIYDLQKEYKNLDNELYLIYHDKYTALELGELTQTEKDLNEKCLTDNLGMILGRYEINKTKIVIFTWLDKSKPKQNEIIIMTQEEFTFYIEQLKERYLKAYESKNKKAKAKKDKDNLDK